VYIIPEYEISWSTQPAAMTKKRSRKNRRRKMLTESQKKAVCTCARAVRFVDEIMVSSVFVGQNFEMNVHTHLPLSNYDATAANRFLGLTVEATLAAYERSEIYSVRVG